VPEVHVVAILAVGAERGVLVGRIGFTAQQKGERHKDSRLYWGVGMSNTAKSLREREVSQGAFMVVHGAPPEERRNVGKLSVRWREERKMASVMKVIVGSEGSRCHLDGRLRPRGPRGRSRDGAQRGARGWCKSQGLEVVGCDVRSKGKSRG
jgi:hypothetical protein